MSCEICHGTSWKTVEIDGVESVTRCDCWRQTVVDRFYKGARIQARYARCELTNFEHDMDSQREAWRKANAFVEAFPVVDKGLLFYGPSGVGKTHLAIGILKEVIRKKGARGYFFEQGELLKLVRDTYNRSVEVTEMDVLRPVLEADVLVLDDLGHERSSEWVQETLGLVVNTRYNAKRPTVFTSNLVDKEHPDAPLDNQFVFQLGVRTRSRLLEMCDWIRIDGVDIREVGPHASAADVGNWRRTSPASPEKIKKASEGFPRSRMARAQLRDKGDKGSVDLKWTGGKAGS
jgi:DNA replication protein DnaC